MAKDPAFLFYPGDWLGGTLTFDRNHKGAYMDLLVCQFNKGHMSLEDVKAILGSDFEGMWENKLKSKFEIDDKGLYYNKKLEYEQDKRKNFTASRRKNLSKISHMKPHMGNHMVDHMENENENVNTNTKGASKSKFSPPTIDDLKDYCKERKNQVDAEKWLSHYESNGWKVGRNPMKDWKASVRTWEKSTFSMETLSSGKQARVDKAPPPLFGAKN